MPPPSAPRPLPLGGEADYLRSVGVASIGVYSTQYQWNVITGGSAAFASSRSWVAGAADAGAAAAMCGTAGFTGGGVELAQYITGGFDADVRCASASPAADFALAASPSTQTIRRGATATYSLAIVRANGFSGSVTWSVVGQPSGSTATFTPNPATANATLAIRPPSSAKGSYALTITGRSGSIEHSTVVTLKRTEE